MFSEFKFASSGEHSGVNVFLDPLAVIFDWVMGVMEYLDNKVEDLFNGYNNLF